jgi:hypothetical protein
MPRKINRMHRRLAVEPNHGYSSQDGAAAGVAWVSWMQLREAVAAQCCE